MQAKTTLGKVFETWKRNNNGTDEEVMALLKATPAQYRELLGEVLTSGTYVTTGDQSRATSESYPSAAAITGIANRKGISASGLTGIIKSL